MSVHPSELARLESIGVAMLDERGEVRAANAAFASILQHERVLDTGVAGWFMQPTFEVLRRRRAEGHRIVHEGWLTVGPPGGVGMGLRGVVLADEAGFVLYVERDVESYEKVAREVVDLNSELAELQREQSRTIATLRRRESELRAALGEVRTLRGLLPICASCKRLRAEDGTWEDLASYVERHSEAKLSHGICEECLDRARAELDLHR